MADRVRFFRRKWVCRIVRTVVGLLLFLIVGTLVTRYVFRWRGQQALAEQLAFLDEKDPRWRWDDLEADRPPVAYANNSALVMAQVIAALGDRPKPEHSRPPFDEKTLNHRLAEPDELAVREMLAGNDEALRLARSLVDYPRGRYPTVLQPDSPTAEVSHLGPVRVVANLLELDAERLALDGRTDAALACVTPMVHAANALDGEPSVVAQIIRAVVMNRAVHRVERTLAMGVPTGDLGPLQALLLAASHADCYTAGVRGERAALDRFCQRFANGDESLAKWQARVSPAVMRTGGPPREPNLPERVKAWAVAGTFLPMNHARMLEGMTRAVDLTALPEPQQWKACPAYHVPFDVNIVLVRMIMPAVEKSLAVHLRTRAEHRCAVVALAAERYRVRNGKWPESLAAIPKDPLAELPLDPFDGKPLKYARRADGVTVYSVGTDGQDDGGFIPAKADGQKGQDVGIRLYDPDQRGLPPIPQTTAGLPGEGEP